MTLVSTLGLVLRASLLLALSLALLPALRSASASLRRWLVLLGLSAALAAPLLALSFFLLAPLFIWFAPDTTRKGLTDFVGEKVG